MSGYASPGDPIGPAPAASAPEARALWHTALSTLAKVDGIDLRELSDAELEVRRGTYARETSWAPVHAGRELRLSRQAAAQAAGRIAASQREAALAGDAEIRAAHEANVTSWRKVAEQAGQAVARYEAAMETREEWERVTEPTRRVAQAADLELRRGHPQARIAPLKSAEPQPDVVPGDPDPTDTEILRALRLTPETAHPESPKAGGHPKRTAEAARHTQARLDELTSMREPSEDPDTEPSEPWADAAERQREAVAQKPEVRVRPAEKVREADLEAAG
jgi:hypothetical protein